MLNRLEREDIQPTRRAPLPNTPNPTDACQLLDGEICASIGACFYQRMLEQQDQAGGMNRDNTPAGPIFTEAEWAIFGNNLDEKSKETGCSQQTEMKTLYQRITVKKKKTDELTKKANPHAVLWPRDGYPSLQFLFSLPPLPAI